MTLRVLMFGWEFPPYKSGGLGTACYHLTKGLARNDVNITFVMPVAPDSAQADFVNLVGTSSIAKNVNIKPIKSTLTAYMSSDEYAEHYITCQGKQVYGKQLLLEVKRYAAIAKTLAKKHHHDVIHAHDWMTFEAAINAKKTSKKPLIVHMHATEFDRTGGNPDPRISHLEWLGLTHADRIITNSHFSKQNIVKHYQIPPEHIDVVHWGMEEADIPRHEQALRDENVVLFLGRVTLQKGPDYFVNVAKHVLDYEPNTKFVMVGTGDMLPRCINRAAELDISNNMVFTGKLSGDDVNRAFQSADVYVMPSVSEPFGLVALESLKNGTPAIISKQSGVSEVLSHVLKIDFWDTREMTNKIVSVLRNPALKQQLQEESAREIKQFNLDKPALAVKHIYEEATTGKRTPAPHVLHSETIPKTNSPIATHHVRRGETTTIKSRRTSKKTRKTAKKTSKTPEQGKKASTTKPAKKKTSPKKKTKTPPKRKKTAKQARSTKTIKKNKHQTHPRKRGKT